MRFFVSGSIAGSGAYALVQPRQGLNPIISDEIFTTSWRSIVRSSTSSSQPFPLIKVSPNSRWVAQNATWETINLWYRDEDSVDGGLYTRVTSFPAAPTTGRCLALSDEYMIVGQYNANPKLILYRLSDNSVLDISSAIYSLGDVRSICFSPDQKKVALTHTSAPNLRVIDLETLTVTEPTISPGSTSHCQFTADGNHIVAFSTTNSTALSCYDATTLERTFVSSTSAHGINSDNNTDSLSNIIQDPLYPSRVFRVAGSNTKTTLIAFDADTKTVTTVISGSNQAGQMAIDPIERKLYCPTDNINGSYLQEIDLDTLNVNAISRYYGVGSYFGSSTNAYLAYIEIDTYKITGVVRDIDNNPASREVRAYKRSTGTLMAKTMSDAITGAYELRLPDQGPYDVQFLTQDGELLNDLFYSKSEPELVV